MPTKDQDRARRAYERVAEVARDRQRDRQDEYKTAVRALGANILRSGLSAALADLMRRGNRASDVIAHLASFEIPGLRSEDDGANLLQKANNLPVGQYMLATRETLQVVMWLKRACEALFEEDPAPSARRSEGESHA